MIMIMMRTPSLYRCFLLLLAVTAASSSSSSSSSTTTTGSSKYRRSGSGSGSSSSREGEGDAQILLKFKASLRNPFPDRALENWESSQPPCSFVGVSCNAASRVNRVDLSSLPLKPDFESVASSLMTLEQLESLSLRSTLLTGALSPPPASSPCAPTLTRLDLSNNSLSGFVSSDLSACFAGCAALVSLNLSINFLEFAVGSGPSSSSNSISNSKSGLVLGSGFSNLQVLDLSFNRISGENAVTTAWLFGDAGCGQLRHLAVKGNKIAGAAPSFHNCSSTLQHLDLSLNNFTGGLPSLGDCSALLHLDLSTNSLSGQIGDRYLPPCRHLQFLNLSRNLFSGPIPPLPVRTLRFLNLSGNSFSGVIPDGLPDDVCPALVDLDLSYNALSGPIPPGLASCGDLQSINLSSNDFQGELPLQTVLRMASLRKLVLAYNQFTGALPASLGSLPSLESLDVSSNNLSGRVPSGLCEDPRTTALKELYLQNNMFVGPIPAALSNCSQLVSLDLSFNYLTGTIPPALGSLSHLRDLILWLNSVSGWIPGELGRLGMLENLILDFNRLDGPIPPELRGCARLNWISLSNNQLTGEIPAWIGGLANLTILKLGNNSFHGSIPPELGDCRSLIWLDLNTNSFTGPIPPSLFKQSGKIALSLDTRKRYSYIKNDGGGGGGDKACHGAGNLLEFAGINQTHLTRIAGSGRSPCNFTSRVYYGIIRPTFSLNGSMIFLDLSYNSLTGSIPREVGSMYYLMILNLAHNNLSGPMPPELGELHSINILDLSHNALTGGIPSSLTRLGMLSEIDLSNNNLSGPIPSSAQFEFPEYKFTNNTYLCGYPLKKCPTGGSGGSGSGGSVGGRSRNPRAPFAGSVAMGLLFSLLCVCGLIIVVLEIRKRRQSKDSSSSATLDVYMDTTTNSGGNPNNPSAWKYTGPREALGINLSTFEKPLRKLTFADLQEATDGFHDDSLIGKGGFGDVYKAKLKDGSIVAIKKLIHVSGQGDREFTAEMETIGKIKHRNLVPLLGYCKVKEERLLVYEYMKFGSLEDVLHDRKKAGMKLNWAARRKIAIGAARGLAFLHHNCLPHIIHRDMKSSNVLLDDNLEARVSDFGMARLLSAMDTHLSVSTLAGTPGYVPPEYYQSFRCSTKGDVYSYGVVLLELLTGRQPTDSADFGDNNLVGWVKQHAKMKISDVFDPVLMQEDPGLEIELLQHLKVASACLDEWSWRRPTMIQVMAMFKEIQAGSGIDSTSTVATDEAVGAAFGALDVELSHP